jgi:tRNA(Ile)-lysidine synthase
MADAHLLINSECINQIHQFKQLIVGFSGGLDSSVLLHLLASYPSLKQRLLAVHINHGLSPNALAWQEHCQKICTSLMVPFKAQSVLFNRAANIEEEARTARFKAFSSLLNQDGCLLLGHHLDDQAETLLLQLIRGTGIDGLAGMSLFSSLTQGVIARPLLTSSRAQLHDYALLHSLQWIDDESNHDIGYSRNYVRHQIMPLLAKKWPGVVGNLARTAAHCQQAKANLSALAVVDCPELLNAQNSLHITPLKILKEERIINVFRAWFKYNKIKLPSSAVFKRLIHELLRSSHDAVPLISWNDVCVRRYQDRIYLEKQAVECALDETDWTTFPHACSLTNELVLFATPAASGFNPPKGTPIKIGFRKGGEKIVLHGQTKQLKKLFQQWNVPSWQRCRIPLLYINDQLAVVVGYAVSDLFYAQTTSSWVVQASEPQSI